ncbi:MAG: peptidase M13 [Burkholderiales bacterium PBB4]|nr:MAG: peptidase M13 [Burkholderiales bacterium PBB4]
MNRFKSSLTLIASCCLLSLAQAQQHDLHDGMGEIDAIEQLFAIADPSPAGSAAAAAKGERMGPWGFDMTGRDLTVRPGSDFFKWANGTWEARTEIPADRTRYGNFDALRALSEDRVRDILAPEALAQSKDRDAAKIAAAWRSFMDETRIEALDAKPLEPLLAAVRATQSHDNMTRLMGQANGGPYRSMLGVYIGDDAKKPDRYTVYMGTGGLGLPDRDYYLDAKFESKKVAYEAYVRKLLDMVSWPDADAAAKEVVALETRVAQVSWSRTERRDRDRTYNPMTMAELQAYAPALPWQVLLAPAKLDQVPKLVLTTNTAVPKVVEVYQATPLKVLQAWQAFHVVDGQAGLLSKRFSQAKFDFRSATLAGQPEEKPRWKRGVDFVNGVVGESVGRMYVERYFPPESKAKMADLVGNIRKAMKQRIEQLDWMSAATKVQAMDKLAKFGVKIGYTEQWRDYSALAMQDNDLLGNSLRANAYEWNRQLARLNQPVDKAEWGMTPQTVNAYYSPVKNEIVFPAAILQPPFFDPLADPAINYGGIGGVIGHEFSHGFDDQGRKSDGDGLLRDWWTAEDAAKFQVQANRLGAQYDRYEPLPGAKVNGKLTMGENIGDLGGLSVALEAYTLSLQGKPAAVIEGTTGTQRVFLGWAQVWRSKSRDEALRQQLVSDPHSPPYYRVNGIVRNMDAWYQAFDIQPTDPLFVPSNERVRIW